MPNPITNFTDSFGVDLGNKLITKEYLMSVYPQIANQLITPELWGWGYNSDGQLGNNNITQQNVPVTTFSGGANWKSIDAGRDFSVAIKTDGTLWTWGRNDKGQMGVITGTLFVVSTPITVSSGSTNWKQISCGQDHAAAIKTDGTLWTWGRNLSGELGNNTILTRSTPVTTFAGGNDWKQVSCGTNCTAAIKTNGSLWNWGGGSNGKLGTNESVTRSTPVTTFAGGNNWKQVSSGFQHTAAIKNDGTLWLWGRNDSYGQLGINTSTNRSTPVTTFAGGNDWKQVATGSNHTVAIKTDGTLWTWGQNGYAQLGNNNVTTSRSPITTFAGGTNWKSVESFGYFSVAIKTDGTLWTWGRNQFGGLGDNTTTNRSTPVTTFAGGTNWKQVATGNNHTVAIKTSDDLQGI